MKQIFAFSLFVALFSFQVNAQQRSCHSVEVLEQAKLNDPNLESRMAEIESFTEHYAETHQHEAGERAVITIPVVVHVIYNTAAQNVSDAQIQSQINVLNADFRKLNADAANIPSIFAGVAADAEIQFCMAQRTPSGAATTGIQRRNTTVTAFGTNDAMKYYAQGGLDAWDATKYLNLWVCNMSGGILGYAQFPGGAAATDGVVVLTSAFGSGGSAAAPFNKGRTATHEVGHWLNLRHIWGDANCGSDLVSDTPTHNTSNYGCPAAGHLSTCSGTPVEMTMNYMDYTDDACMYMFSTGQKTRMQALFAAGGSRVGLTTSNGCTPVDPNACNPASNLAATGVTQTAATLGWSAAANAVSYNVQYKASSAATWTTVNTASTSYALTGLTAATAYSFQVQTVCANGSSAYSAAVSFTTGSTASACTDTYESNNTKNTSKTIPTTSSITAKIGTSTDIDWYKYATTSSKLKTKVTMTNLPADYDMVLYRGNSQVAISQNDATADEVCIHNTGTSAATYYVKVYGYNGATSANCYTLTASIGSTNYRMEAAEEAEITAVMENELLVYPNPVDGVTKLDFFVETEAPTQVKVMDLSGRVVMNQTLNLTKESHTVDLDMSKVTNGMYIITVQHNGTFRAAKVIVSNR